MNPSSIEHLKVKWVHEATKFGIFEYKISLASHKIMDEFKHKYLINISSSKQSITWSRNHDELQPASKSTN